MSEQVSSSLPEPPSEAAATPPTTPPTTPSGATSPPHAVAPLSTMAPGLPGSSLLLFGAGLIGGLAVAVLLVIPTIVRAIGFGGRFVPGGGFADPFGLLVPLVVIAGLAWLVLLAVPRLSRSGDALEILRRRFARGEISAEEYARVAEILRHG